MAATYLPGFDYSEISDLLIGALQKLGDSSTAKRSCSALSSAARPFGASPEACSLCTSSVILSRSHSTWRDEGGEGAVSN